jgi:hypothetical protein
VKALLHSVYDQPDAAAVHAQFDRILDALKITRRPDQTPLQRTWPSRRPKRPE